VVEQKITEGVAFVIDFGFLAQTRRFEERERLESFQSRPALDHRVRRTRHCKTNGKSTCLKTIHITYIIFCIKKQKNC